MSNNGWYAIKPIQTKPEIEPHYQIQFSIIP